MRKRWLGLVLVMLAAAAAPQLAGAKVTSGFWGGTTSQSQGLLFKFEHTRCGTPRAPKARHKAECFEGGKYAGAYPAYTPTMVEPCNDQSTAMSPLYAADTKVALTSSGRLALTTHGSHRELEYGSNSPVPVYYVSVLKLQVRGGHLKGSAKQTESYTAGGTSVTCASGTVSFTATPQG